MLTVVRIPRANTRNLIALIRPKNVRLRTFTTNHDALRTLCVTPECTPGFGEAAIAHRIIQPADVLVLAGPFDDRDVGCPFREPRLRGRLGHADRSVAEGSTLRMLGVRSATLRRIASESLPAALITPNGTWPASAPMARIKR